MRCNQAIISAFLVHPEYQRFAVRPPLLDVAGLEAARFAAPDIARAIVSRDVDRLVVEQSRTGLWKHPSRGKKEHAPAVSYRVLAALHRAGMLAEIGSATLPLRYDPFLAFASREDHHGLLVRRVFGRSQPDDSALCESLIREISARQRGDGSWSNTIVGTALMMERLLDLGMPPETSAVTHGAQWLLGQYQEQVRQRSVEALSLFTTPDAQAELACAIEEIPETIPVLACYGLLPLIPTGLALRVLVMTGYANDPRVAASYASLLRLGRPTYGEDGVALTDIKGWCSHQCMFYLEAEAKARRKKSVT